MVTLFVVSYSSTDPYRRFITLSKVILVSYYTYSTVLTHGPIKKTYSSFHWNLLWYRIYSSWRIHQRKSWFPSTTMKAQWWHQEHTAVITKDNGVGWCYYSMGILSLLLFHVCNASSTVHFLLQFFCKTNWLLDSKVHKILNNTILFRCLRGWPFGCSWLFCNRRRLCEQYHDSNIINGGTKGIARELYN